MADIDKVTYLEVGEKLWNRRIKNYSDSVAYEQIFSNQFEKHEFFKAEHKVVVWKDELRMETYLGFMARHTNDDDNVIQVFAGSKVV